jgi:hypothetical protein
MVCTHTPCNEYSLHATNATNPTALTVAVADSTVSNGAAGPGSLFAWDRLRGCIRFPAYAASEKRNLLAQGVGRIAVRKVRF